MPVSRRSRQGSNSAAAKLITKANLGKNIVTNSNGDGMLTKLQQQLQRNAFLETLTKEQLKLECRKRGQKTSGNKVELLQRLGYKMALQQQHSEEELMADGKSSNINGIVVNTQKQNKSDRKKLLAERKGLVLWKSPIETLKFAGLECAILLQIYGNKLLQHKKSLVFIGILVTLLSVLYHIPGRHQLMIDYVKLNGLFIVYWVGLGVLSSVGLGTGLHTFLLYLGPHIASVTLAAYECNSLDFPEPPYPNEILCPENVDTTFFPSMLQIMSKVRLEAFLWGAGTALGELPPYFMAKAARLSGYDPEDQESLQEFEELQKKSETGAKLNMIEKGQLLMERFVEKVGFFGILMCASIPNPLFDLAGITCGHFLVPFWTFFGATLIGKAVIKMHIQKIFVIIAFNETFVDKAVDLLVLVPVIGKKLQEPFKAFLQNQKTKLHGGAKAISKKAPNLIQVAFEWFVISMILYFVLSIINSLAQSYHKRLHKNKKSIKKSS